MPDTGLIDIMPWRLSNLEATVRAFLQTGVPLVRVGPTGLYSPANPTDDPGLFLFVPWIAKLFGVDAVAGKDALLIGIVVVAFLTGAAGILWGFRTRAGKIVGVLGLAALAAVTLKVGDVYTVSSAVLMGLVPWVIGVTRNPSQRALLWLGAAGGLAAGWANLMRSQAGTAAVLVTVLAIALLRDVPWKRRFASLALVATGLLVVAVSLAAVEARRDAYLETVPRDPAPAAVGHPFWHTVYIGLGYVPNAYGLAYDDRIAEAKVESIAPGEAIGSKRYERILRDEVLALVKSDPSFIARVEVAKAARIAIFLLAFANIGLLAWVLARPPAVEWLPVTAALAYTALPGFVAIPRPDYLLGFIAMSVLIGILGIDGWLWSRTLAASRSRGA